MLSDVELYNLKDKTIGEKIKWLRGHKCKNDTGSMTSQELADVLDMSPATINSLEKSGNCTSEKLLAVADYFDVSIDWLYSLPGVGKRYIDFNSVCNYTGLKPKTIQFFRDNQTNDGYKDTVDLIECLVDKLSYSIDDCLAITDLRECTTALSLSCEYDDKITLNKLEKQYEDFENLDESINGKKYKLSQLFNEVLDDYSVSNIEDLTYNDLRFNKRKLLLKRKELFKNTNLKTYIKTIKEANNEEEKS